MSIDFTKPVQTKNGRKVRVFCTDRNDPYPVVVWFDDEKRTAFYTSEGRSFIGAESPFDLMNVPEEVTVDTWLNFYDTHPGYRTKEEAVRASGRDRRATLHIKRTVPVGHVDE